MTKKMEGVYLPLITPFQNGGVDYESLKNLIQYYINSEISGLIPLATTGEIPSIIEEEYFKMIDFCIETVKSRVPLYIGFSGNCTDKMLKKLEILSRYEIEGLLVTAPYYNLPSQEGILNHFTQLAQNTDLDLILYNIPYRTGRNVENETILKLAEVKNIIGIKDSCGNLKQSLELIRNSPKTFSVLTGEDLFFMGNLANGGDGAILASAHIHPELFVSVYNCIKKNDFNKSLATWLKISGIIQFLFAEPNPAPIKHILYKEELISSDEVRSPLCKVSTELSELLIKTYKQME